jgi:site-specific DNA-methyltransferase (adenine-specific)
MDGPEYDPEADSIGSFHAAIRAIGERVKAGEPLPTGGYFARKRITVHHGDCLNVIPTLGVTVDAVVTDPPYHLLSIVKRFGSPTSAPVRVGDINASGDLKAAYARQAAGFMGTTWDGGDVAFRPETWATIATALRPGGFLLAFGGTRTYHRMACAIEDAGFVIQDCIMWLYGSGFPKRRDMLKGDPHRFARSNEHPGWSRPSHTPENIAARGDRAFEVASAMGRWPANVCHDGSEEVLAGFPESDAGQPMEDRGRGGFWGASDGLPCGPQYGDSGSAARYFYCTKADAEDRWGSRHPTVKPVDLMKWLVLLVTPKGGVVLDPFAGTGTTGIAALGTGRNAILIEREAQYIADIRERVRFHEGTAAHSLVSKARRAASPPPLPLFEGYRW